MPQEDYGLGKVSANDNQVIPGWLAYVPRYIACEILAHPDADPVGREQRFNAVTLFADVSGFTAISEALGQTGRQGTEELTTILNRYFGFVIDLVHSYGGIVGKFGGDALTIVFPFTDETNRQTSHRALQCALDIQAAMGPYASIDTSVGAFSLTMKIGVAIGQVFATTVGDTTLWLEHILAGSVLDRCADAEHHAFSGEVVVDNALLKQVDGIALAGERNGYSLVVSLAGEVERWRPSHLVHFPASIKNTFNNYVHPLIIRRIEENQADLINEHRRVTVLFVHFTGFDYDQDPDVGQKLQRYFIQVIHIVQRYDGYLNKIDMGDKGSKYMVFFGAPIAHEDDPERAVRCGLELTALPEAQVQIGINTGFAYCGQVGSTARQEYTAIGDTINFAARLMQAAQANQILVSTATWTHVAQNFEWGISTMQPVKGKATPFTAFPVLGIREALSVDFQEPVYSLPMVGRARELELALKALEPSKASRGQVLYITAEAGMGKSRLAAEITRHAVEQGFSAYAGACQSYGSETSYLVWRAIWRAFFGLSPDWPRAQQIQHLEYALASLSPGLVQRMPLLDIVLNLPLPENGLTSSLNAQVRAEMLRSLLLDCLRLRTQNTTILFILEDCHWIDPLSQELLALIGRNLADLPVLLLLLSRPPDKEGDLLDWTGTSADHVQRLHLDDLTPEDAVELARLKFFQLWGQADEMPAGLIEKIIAKAQGNPFYLEEIVHLLHDQAVDDQAIDMQDKHALDALQIPDSLHNLILSRIDRLSEDERTTIKVASAIGRHFKASWVWGSYPQVGTPEVVQVYLQTLSRLELTPLERSEPELEYMFKHITTQEVAYDSLAFTTRAALNENIGNFIEKSYTDELPQYVNELAYYYGRSHNTDKQRSYFRQAGNVAKTSYANQAAIDYYQRLLPLLSQHEQAEVQVELGEIWQLTGQWEQAEATYRDALAWSEQEDDVDLKSFCQTALGSLLARIHSYEEALAWFEQARLGFERVGNRRGTGRVMEQLSFAYSHLGDYDEAIACAEQQLQIATELQEPADISAALDYMGVAYFHKGDFEQAMMNLQRALDVALSSGDRRREIQACNDLAGVYWQQGTYEQSIIYLQQAEEAAATIGYRQAMGFNLVNLASLYGQMGEWEYALSCAGQALAVAMELGDWPNILRSLGSIAMFFKLQTRYAEAEAVQTRTIELARTLKSPYDLCDYLYELATLCHLQGRSAECQPMIQEALAIAEELDARDVLFNIQVQAIRVRFALHQMDLQHTVNDLEALLDKWPGKAEQAALHYEIWHVDPEQQASRETAARLYQELYAIMPNIEYRTRHEAITGEQLYNLVSVPPLPEHVQNANIDLALLLQRSGVQL